MLYNATEKTEKEVSDLNPCTRPRFKDVEKFGMERVVPSCLHYVHYADEALLAFLYATKPELDGRTAFTLQEVINSMSKSVVFFSHFPIYCALTYMTNRSLNFAISVAK